MWFPRHPFARHLQLQRRPIAANPPLPFSTCHLKRQSLCPWVLQRTKVQHRSSRDLADTSGTLVEPFRTTMLESCQIDQTAAIRPPLCGRRPAHAGKRRQHRPPAILSRGSTVKWPIRTSVEIPATFRRLPAVPGEQSGCIEFPAARDRFRQANT